MRVLDLIFWLFAAGVVAFIAWNFLQLLVSAFTDRGRPTPARKPREGNEDSEGTGGLESGAALAGTYAISSDSTSLDSGTSDSSSGDSGSGDSSSGESGSGGGDHSGGGGDYGGGGSSGGW